ncbi:MAG: pyruvate ferredoxin oxidoreductase [Candidatus Moranbacteria bacterium]|nr:pyruvate ferredoxin oxidoreductase [Candidatus Moranbacteria bacterium]
MSKPQTQNQSNNDKNNRIKFAPGHRTCAGCPAPVITRTVLNAISKPVVVANATGCLEVATTIYPQTSWNVPFIHSAFENAAATISGIETAYRNLIKDKLKLDKKINFSLNKDLGFLVFGGDGGTYDIGLQSLSGALERGHDFLYVCYNNQGYMNTGGQRSSATPRGARTSTTPSGSASQGKIEWRKNLMEIVEAHNIPYLAQASIFNLVDLTQKVQKAMSFQGPKFIHVLSPCPTVWKFPPRRVKEVTKLALDTRFWPIYEIEQGVYRINYQPKEPKPVEEFLKTQKRFQHLFKGQEAQKTVIQTIQSRIDQEWEKLDQKVALTQPAK